MVAVEEVARFVERASKAELCVSELEASLVPFEGAEADVPDLDSCLVVVSDAGDVPD